MSDALADAAQSTFELIAEYTSDVIVRTGHDGLVDYISPSVRNYGYEPADLIGQDGSQLLHPDDREHFRANSEALLRGELDTTADRRHRMRTASGDWVWMEGNPRIVFDAEGRPAKFLNIFRDVTHRHRLEEQAREQAELFEAAFRHAGVGKALVALDGAFMRINEAFCRITGYPEAELLALNFQTITHPADLETDLVELQRLAAGEIDGYRMDKRYIRADGALIWVHLTVSMVRAADGAPKHYVAQVQDLTARHAAETALAESEARYRLIAENTSDMIFVTDLKGRATYASPSVGRYGGDPDAIVGREPQVAIHPDDLPQMNEAFRQTLKGALGRRVRWRGRDGRGGWMWLESRPILLRNPVSGEPSGFLDVVREITAQVEQEEALAEARAAAEAAAAAKSQFLANMSHEIRTPLTAVLGFTGLLRDDPTVTGAAAGYVDRIAGAGNGLLAIVNDVLDFSKLEAGHFEIRPRPTNLGDVCRETLEIFARQAEEKGLALAFEAAPGVPETALVDADRLRQMLINLIGNAVKFTETGGVTLGLAPAEAPGMVAISVADTGPGLDEAAQARLFQRFTQIDGSNTRRHGGTGLGLAICKGLSEAMGGGIGVESTYGAGAVFRVVLPAPTAELSPDLEGEADLPSIEGLRVLVVDDNAVNRELARHVLEAVGAEVSEAASGAAALDLLAQLPLDVVLMDLRMPDLDGRGTTARLRAAPGPNQGIPVLAFTADADVASAHDLDDFDGAVRKPVAPLELCRSVALAAGWLAADDDLAAVG